MEWFIILSALLWCYRVHSKAVFAHFMVRSTLTVPLLLLSLNAMLGWKCLPMGCPQMATRHPNCCGMSYRRVRA